MHAPDASPYSASRLKTGALIVLSGKALTAALTFCGFVLVARLLRLDEYGLYASAVAFLEVGIAVAMAGMDWVAARLVPEYRLKASGAMLARFVGRLLLIQAVCLAVLAAGVYFGALQIGEFLGFSGAQDFLRVYALVLLIEGVARVLRDELLSVLMRQAEVLVAQIIRNTTFVALLWLADGQGGLMALAKAELVAASFGLILGALGLGLHLWRGWRRPAADASWQPLSMAESWRIARNSYMSYLMLLAAGPQVLTLLFARIAGAEAAGLYGFARNFVEQVRRVLPADLLIGVVRPVIVARYVASQDFAELNRHVRLMWMGSLFPLVPLLGFFLIYGEDFVRLVGRGEYAGAAAVICVLLLVLAGTTHRRMVEIAANSVLRSDLCSRSSVVMLLVPLMGAAVLFAGGGVIEVLAGVFITEVVFNGLVVHGLRRAGFSYHVGWHGVARLGVILCAATVLVWIAPATGNGWGGLAIATALTATAVLIIAALVRPFEAAHREAINQFLGRRIFPF